MTTRATTRKNYPEEAIQELDEPNPCTSGYGLNENAQYEQSKSRPREQRWCIKRRTHRGKSKTQIGELKNEPIGRNASPNRKVTAGVPVQQIGKLACGKPAPPILYHFSSQDEGSFAGKISE